MQPSEQMDVYKQGAEAKLYIRDFLSKRCLVKERFKKHYRHPDLEKALSSKRTKNEVRAMVRCRQCGIPTPSLYYVDGDANKIYMEYLENCFTLKEYIDALLLSNNEDGLVLVAQKVGQLIAKLHTNNIIHGDLTTSNMLVRGAKENSEAYQLVLIDFGLTTIESTHLDEDKGVDLYVLERAFLSTHPNTEKLFESILTSYQQSYKKSKEVLAKLEEVRLRGRKRTMVG